MTISAIVAVGKNRIIGRDNQIPWYLPADLGYFKRMTLNHHIIMGRNSFQSIGRPFSAGARTRQAIQSGSNASPMIAAVQMSLRGTKRRSNLSAVVRLVDRLLRFARNDVK